MRISPLMAASAALLYIERYQHEPKPIRWQFSGPIFRYEAPQRSHSRQFTMLGMELIGPSGISGDAEAMGMAAQVGLPGVGTPQAHTVAEAPRPGWRDAAQGQVLATCLEAGDASTARTAPESAYEQLPRGADGPKQAGCAREPDGRDRPNARDRATEQRAS